MNHLTESGHIADTELIREKSMLILMKQVVVDDVDLCMQHIIEGRNIAACSIATYDPSDVALRPEIVDADDPAIGRPAQQLTCRSML